MLEKLVGDIERQRKRAKGATFLNAKDELANNVYPLLLEMCEVFGAQGEDDEDDEELGQLLILVTELIKCSRQLTAPIIKQPPSDILKLLAINLENAIGSLEQFVDETYVLDEPESVPTEGGSAAQAPAQEESGDE